MANYYYLCADLHLYQAGTIIITNTRDDTSKNKMLIHQYIVGTGGTKLDDSPFLQAASFPLDDELAFSNDELTVNYTMADEQKRIAHNTSKKYGFLSCVLKRSNMYFTFIDTEGQEYSEKNTRTNRRTTTRKSGRRTNGRRTNKRTIID